MKDMTKKFLAFDMNRDGVSCMGPEVNKHRMFEMLNASLILEMIQFTSLISAHIKWRCILITDVMFMRR